MKRRGYRRGSMMYDRTLPLHVGPKMISVHFPVGIYPDYREPNLMGLWRDEAETVLSVAEVARDPEVLAQQAAWVRRQRTTPWWRWGKQ